jgi:hypothetical protein
MNLIIAEVVPLAGTVDKPFNELGEAALIPGNEALQRFNQPLR